MVCEDVRIAYNLDSTPPSSPLRPQNTREPTRKRRSPNGEDRHQRNKRQRGPNTEDGLQRNKRKRGSVEPSTSEEDPEESEHNRENSDNDWYDEEEDQQRLPRRRSFEKCQYIVAYMTKRKYTISNFLENYCTKLFTCAKEGNAYHQAKQQFGMRKRYIAQALSSSVVEEAVNSARSSKIKIVRSDDLSGWSTEWLLKQLDNLVGKWPFVAWDSKEDDLASSLQKINIQAAVETIGEHAPVWMRMLSEILQHPRSDQPSAPKEKENQGLRRQYMIFMITAMVFRFRAQQKANLPVTELSLYLESNEVRQRAIEVLSKFGITLSPSQLRQRRNTIAEQAKKGLKRIGQDPRAVVVYDNFDFMDTVRDQVTVSRLRRNKRHKLQVHA